MASKMNSVRRAGTASCLAVKTHLGTRTIRPPLWDSADRACAACGSSRLTSGQLMERTSRQSPGCRERPDKTFHRPIRRERSTPRPGIATDEALGNRSLTNRTPRPHRTSCSVRDCVHTDAGRVEYGIGVRPGITLGRHAALVTLGYRKRSSASEVALPDRSAGLSQGSCEPHRNPTSPRHGGRSPQESHGRNGTLRYTC
jgi:hypothetical protein